MEYQEKFNENEGQSKIMSDIPKRENKIIGFFRNTLVFILLVGIIAGSFWLSFFLGKRILSPTKEAVQPKIDIELEETKPADLERALKELEEKEEVTAPIVIPEKKIVVEKSAPAKTTPVKIAAAKSGMLYKVIAGTFSGKTQAASQANKLKAIGFETFVRQFKDGFRVQAGAFLSKSNAQSLIDSLRKKGFASTLIYER
jgi:cell division protein FtsN